LVEASSGLHRVVAVLSVHHLELHSLHWQQPERLEEHC
jgi:hypothetical protein